MVFVLFVGEAVILDAEPYIRHFFEDVLYNSFTRWNDSKKIIVRPY